MSEALWWGTMTDLAVLRERLVDIGRRDARERVAHLIYEMLVRFRTVGATDDDVMPWPITQDELADATGLTTVHINRTLRQLREEGLVETNRREMKVLDADRLREVSGFNPNYLHLIRTEQRAGKVAERAGYLAWSWEVRPLPRYHFHLHDRDGLTKDSQGREFADLAVVRERAIREARAIICDDVRHGRLDLSGRIEVADGRGEVVLTLRFAEAVEQV